MGDYVKAAGLVLVSVVLCLVLSGQNKSFPVLIAIAVCSIVTIAALQYIRPLLDFFDQLRAVGKFDSELLTILIKAVGIGILSEITALICADSGNSALGKSLQILTTAVILWLSLPLFTGLMELVKQLLEKI